MKVWKWALVFIPAISLGLAAAAWGAEYPGKFTGTVAMHLSVPATQQEIDNTGTAEITITKKSETKFDLAIKTNITGRTPTEETTEYTLAGGKLTLTSSTTMSGMVMDTTASFQLTGSEGKTLAGTVTSTGKLEGETQTTSTMTFNLQKQ